MDQTKNGKETDVDCGGDCPGCPSMAICDEDSDCESEMCRKHICVGCKNGLMDWDETDVDCGGTECQRCPDLMNCIQDSDCENENCGPLGACVSCDDDVQDGDESDVDCGGDFCDGCEDGWRCSDPSDCLSGGCEYGICCTLNRCERCGALPKEDCNDVDDDCDGQTDENLGYSICGKGVCSQEIQTSCVDGTWESCDPYFGADDEQCNLLDDDCDGLTDDGLGTYSCGKGRCKHSVANCENGKKGSCDPYLGARSESCNNIDDDCDGSTDESLGSYSCGVGICKHVVYNCEAGATGVCNTKLGAKGESCNKLDDDCDGRTDDDNACVVASARWTGYWSEESPNCYNVPDDYVFVGWRCSGDFCDRQSVLQGRAPFKTELKHGLQSGEFSEEQGAFVAPTGEIIAGACCYGDYCDRLRYYTATTPFLMNTDCKWTSNVSDEQGYNGLKFDAGYYPVGVRCYGDYCDSKSFKICKP